MIFDNFCLKIYFWPFLSYLANLKGWCPLYPPGFIPVYILPPNVNLPSTIPVPTILPPCPADPLVCLPGGLRPIKHCPCIDPRQQNGPTTMRNAISKAIENGVNIQLRLASSNQTTDVMESKMMKFSHLDNSKRRKRRKKRAIFKEEIVE